MKSQPQKRATIFKLYEQDDLKAAALGVVRDEMSDENLVVSSIKYLSSVRDLQSIQDLSKMANSRSENVSLSALHAIARLDPKSKILEEKTKIFVDGKDNGQIAAALRLAMDIVKPPSGLIFRSDPDREYRIRMGSKILLDVMNKNFIFGISSGFRGDSRSNLVISARGEVSTRYIVSSEWVSGVGQRAIRGAFLEVADDFQKLSSLISMFCIVEDESCSGGIHVKLTQGGKIVLRSGLVLDNRSVAGSVVLRPSGAEANADIIVNWTDLTAVPRNDALAAVSEADKMELRVISRVRLAPEDVD